MRQITLPPLAFDTLEGRLYQGNFAHEFGCAPITLGDVMLYREEERTTSADMVRQKEDGSDGADITMRDWAHLGLLASFTLAVYGAIAWLLL